MAELTGSIRIRLSQIIDLELWADAFVEDAKHYEIGEVSPKTGLQKTLVNGRIVWLLPKQGGGFYQGKIGKSDTKAIAKTTRLARPDGSITFTANKNIRNVARNYLNHMRVSWNNSPVICPFLNYTRVGLNRMSFDHLFYKKGHVPRKDEEIKDRAECLPFIRDILQRTGKPVDHSFDNGKESFSIAGKAEIDQKKQEVLVIITRKPMDKYFYLSVFKIK